MAKTTNKNTKKKNAEATQATQTAQATPVEGILTIIDRKALNRAKNPGVLKIHKNQKKFRCATCGQYHHLGELNARQFMNARRSGQCPDCYAKSVEARKEMRIQAKEQKQKEREAKLANKVASPFDKVKQMITESHIDDERAAFLTDQDWVRANLKMSYPVLRAVDPNVSVKDACTIAKKKRFARHTIYLNDKEYYITNHVYKKDVPAVRTKLIEWGFIRDEDYPAYAAAD